MERYLSGFFSPVFTCCVLSARIDFHGIKGRHAWTVFAEWTRCLGSTVYCILYYSCWTWMLIWSQISPRQAMYLIHRNFTLIESKNKLPLYKRLSHNLIRSTLLLIDFIVTTGQIWFAQWLLLCFSSLIW